MVKRASGFSPKTGDWEYLVLDGAITKIRERHKKGERLSVTNQRGPATSCLLYRQLDSFLICVI